MAPTQHPQPDSPPDSRVAEENKSLAIALQEYVYWRDCESENPHFNDVQIGAICAASNIAGRIALPGVPLEGLAYPELTLVEIASAGAQIRFARRMVTVLKIVHEFFAALERDAEPDDPLTKLRATYHAPIHAVLDPLIEEFRKEGLI